MTLLVAIDLDGTLVDSLADLHKAVTLMQQALNIPVSDKGAVSRWVGNGVDRLVHRAVSGNMDGEIPAADFERAKGLFVEAYAQTNGRYSDVFPGVVEGLDYLKQLDCKMAMITNKPSGFAHELLQRQGIDHYFPFCVCGDDVKQKKPDPEPLLIAARHYDVSGDDCIMIGDSASDMKAANAAGFRAICVSYGYRQGMSIADFQEKFDIDSVIDSFVELEKLL